MSAAATPRTLTKLIAPDGIVKVGRRPTCNTQFFEFSVDSSPALTHSALAHWSESSDGGRGGSERREGKGEEEEEGVRGGRARREVNDRADELG